MTLRDLNELRDDYSRDMSISLLTHWDELFDLAEETLKKRESDALKLYREVQDAEDRDEGEDGLV